MNLTFLEGFWKGFRFFKGPLYWWVILVIFWGPHIFSPVLRPGQGLSGL